MTDAGFASARDDAARWNLGGKRTGSRALDVREKPDTSDDSLYGGAMSTNLVWGLTFGAVIVVLTFVSGIDISLALAYGAVGAVLSFAASVFLQWRALQSAARRDDDVRRT